MIEHERRGHARCLPSTDIRAVHQKGLMHPVKVVNMSASGLLLLSPSLLMLDETIPVTLMTETAACNHSNIGHSNIDHSHIENYLQAGSSKGADSKGSHLKVNRSRIKKAQVGSAQVNSAEIDQLGPSTEILSVDIECLWQEASSSHNVWVGAQFVNLKPKQIVLIAELLFTYGGQIGSI